MYAETGSQQLSDRVIRQVELDSFLSLERAKYSLEMSEVTRLSCVSVRSESESQFGRQIWYFNAVGIDSGQRASSCFGVLQYSIEFGLLELVQGQVFDSDHERDLYLQFCETGKRTQTWWHPANRWLLGGLVSVGMIWILYLMYLMSS